MKRLKTAVCLLITLVLLCALHLHWMDTTVTDITARLHTAEHALHSGDRGQFAHALQQAQEFYQAAEPLFSITIHEKQLDEVRADLARTEASAQTDDDTTTLIELAGLLDSMDDLRRSEVVTVGNLF